MNRIWWKRIAAIVVFLISLFVIDFILNRDNSEITMDMPKATLPVVSVLSENHKVNTMYGYTSKREEAYTKDSITPISGNREITIVHACFKCRKSSPIFVYFDEKDTTPSGMVFFTFYLFQGSYLSVPCPSRRGRLLLRGTRCGA